MSNKVMAAVLILLTAIAILAWAHLVGTLVLAVVPPCNPICFPGIYDEENPDCPCNR